MNILSNILLIGAGNIGSRHLQALKAVNIPLNITVIDPNPDSLKIAEERYSSMPLGHHEHTIQYLQNYDNVKGDYDIAIIATHSNNRRMIIEQIITKFRIKSFILEKILFDKKEDYSLIKELLDKHNCQAWVNCTRRIIPFYKDKIKDWYNNKKILFIVSGSHWGLMSNIIHFLDYMAYILDEYEFSIDFSNLNLKFLNSRIPNFSEMNGAITVYFKKGSLGIINCYPSGKQPLIIDIASDENRCIINEVEGKSWVNNNNNEMGWEEYDSKILYTSQLTTSLVEDIIKNNKCSLVSYENSMKLHLSLFEPLLKVLREKLGYKKSNYPFT